MKPNKVKYLVLAITLLASVNQANAQQAKDISLFGYAKSHQFYNQGVYKITETSKATGYGFGVSINKPLNNHLSIFGGYGIALADSLQYGDNHTSNALFHQLDVNLSVNLLTGRKLRPYMYTGYAYNHIQQIDLFGMKNDAMNINAGAGMEYSISDAFGLGYQLTYAFSLKENIPFNFRHQFGVVYYPRSFVKRDRTKVTEETNSRHKETIDNTELTQLKVVNAALAHKNDSLRNILGSKVEPVELLEDKGLIVSYNDELLGKIKHLEEDNQLLLDELRSKRYASDSIYRFDYNGYTVIDTAGQVQNISSLDLESGYYLMAKNLNTIAEMRIFNRNKNFISLKKKVFLIRNNKYYVLGFVGNDREAALKVLSAITSQKYNYAIIKI